MKLRQPRILLAASMAAALIAAGCGSSSSSNSGGSGGSGGGGGSGSNVSSGGGGGYGAYGSSSSSSSSSSAATGAASISAKSNGDLGKTILVDAKGNTLYLFEKDESDESYCNGACAQVWPPLTTSGQPKAGSGVDASKLGTLKRDDGTTQVTYAGHPLYTYVKDTKPGEANGNGVEAFGAEWYALEPSGAKAEEHGGGGES